MEFSKIIAHRGLHGNGVPENSLKAFRLAAEKGIAAELDVRLSRDGKLVVFHDKSLKRMCGADVEVSRLTYDELSGHRLNGTSERIPLLKDVLCEIDGRVPLLIEIKRGSPFWLVEKRLNRLLKGYHGDYAVQSFDPISMLWFRLFAPDTFRGQLVSDCGGGSLFEKIMLKVCSKPWVWKLISDPDFVSCDLRCISLEKVFGIIDRGAEVFTWTARTPELIEAASAFSSSVIAENIPENLLTKVK